MANEMLTGLLGQKKGSQTTGTTTNPYGGAVPSPVAQPQQTVGFQNRTNNPQWWKGGAAPATTGAPAPMGATSGYGSSTPTPYTPPSDDTGTDTVDDTATEATVTTTAAAPSGYNVWRNAQIYQGFMDKLANFNAKKGRTGRFSGSPQEIAQLNQSVSETQQRINTWKAQLEQSMADYKGYGSWGGTDPRAQLMDYSSKMGNQNISALLDSMYGPSAPRMTPPGYVDPAGFGASFGGPTFGGGPPIPPKGGGWR